MSGSARSHRRTEPIVPLQPRRKTHKVRHCLLSCCLFFAVLSACLIAALVLIGKHYYKNDPTNASGGQQKRPQAEVLRLPQHTVPKSYDLVLRPNLTTGSYVGVVNISIEIVGVTSDVVLHSKGLQITQVELYNVNNSKVEVRDVKENALDEIITVSAREELFPDEYFLVIAFGGSLLNRTNGFYRSQYFNEENNTRRSIATSKFEPTHARKAFPCFDEPNMKAKFTIHLLKPKDPAYISLSNMPEESETEEEDGIMVHFQESVSMSTYLACFIVSDFTASKDTIVSDIGNIPFRVFASPGQLNKTEYARDTGKKIMEFYLKYFNIPYPLPKLDMVAIPDFSSGAMEHWGLVTYRETALLYGQNISSSVNKQRVATVVAHELAHSWFGNLVTMDWWNDLWLNEGFASYIEYKGVNFAEPDWHMMSQFLIEDMHSVLKLDATLASHPIVQKVETPDQIVEIFDSISYNKGAAVLRMLEAAVGNDVFQQGVTNYLNKNKYGNAVTQDLLDELQALKKDFNVTEFMATWTIQMGYPIVNVQKIDGGYRLTQKRYLTDPNLENSYPPVQPYNYRWTIPITYISSKSSEPTLVWFDHKDEYVDIKIDVDWIKFNHDQVGYYRVNYAQDDWNKLISRYGKFGVSDRTHLLEESFRIAESGQLDYSVPLELTKQLLNETDYVPWDAASTVLKQIKTHMTTSGQISNIKQYIIKILKPAYEELSWEELPEDPHLTRRARTTVISLACSADDKDALERSQINFQQWLNDGVVISQDLKTIIYTYGMISATKEEWEKVLNLFLAEQDAGEKIRLLGGLANVNNIHLLQRLIELSKNETYIRRQDYFTCIRSISSNPAGTALVWDYVRENWPMLVEMFGLNDSHLGGLIPHITKTFATNTKKEEILAFFKLYPDAGAGVQSRKQALETVENNINWQAKNKEVIEKWISNNQNFE